MNTFTQQLKDLWARQGLAGRILLGGSAAVLALVCLGVGFWANQTNYAVLFSGLALDDAAAITQKLDSDRVTYKLSADGATILVPADRLQKTRMGLAVSGLMGGGHKGYEIFDEMSLGATPFQMNVNYIRAIQGELAKTIMTLEPVAHARVHIVQPESTPFIREQNPVTASVVVKTHRGAVLNRAATQGIVALVAGSVKSLSRENVTVLDTDGKVLSEKQKTPQSQASTENLAHQMEVEMYLAAKAQELLTRAVGADRALVRVTADMTFRHVRETSEKYDPDGKVVQRESTTSVKTTGPAGTGGPTGTASNLPPAGARPTAGSSGPSANEESIESEYVVSKTNLAQEEQKDTINRLTVAVMLTPPDFDVPLKESLGITPEEVERLVKQAIGFQEGRDQIQVSIGKSAEAAVEAAIDQQIFASQTWQNYGSVAKASSLGVAALSLLAIGLLSLRSRPATTTPPAATSSADLQDLHAVAGTIKAWLEEAPPVRPVT